MISTSESSSPPAVSRGSRTSDTARSFTSWRCRLEVKPTHTRQAVVVTGVDWGLYTEIFSVSGLPAWSGDKTRTPGRTRCCLPWMAAGRLPGCSTRGRLLSGGRSDPTITSPSSSPPTPASPPHSKQVGFYRVSVSQCHRNHFIMQGTPLPSKEPRGTLQV